VLWARNPAIECGWRGGAGASSPSRVPIPPAAKLARLRRIAHIDGAIERGRRSVAWREIGGAAREMDGLAVDEPELVDGR